MSRPSAPMMNRAMHAWGDDQVETVLENKIAGLLGKESALWMPSGTMANLAIVLTLVSPGATIITEADTHLAYFERKAVERLGRVTVKTLMC